MKKNKKDTVQEVTTQKATTLETIVPKPSKKAVIEAMVEIELSRATKAWEKEEMYLQAEDAEVNAAIDAEVKAGLRKKIEEPDMSYSVYDRSGSHPHASVYVSIGFAAPLCKRINALHRRACDHTAATPSRDEIRKNITAMMTNNMIGSVADQAKALLENPAIVGQLEAALDAARGKGALLLPAGSSH